MTSRERILNEKDPEVLRFYIDRLLKEKDRQDQVISDLSRRMAVRAQTNLSLEDQLTVLRKKFFGKSSEKRKSIESRLRQAEDEDVLVHSQSLLPPLKKEQFKKLDEEIIYHVCSELELLEMSHALDIKDASASNWEKVENFYDESTEVTVIERQYKKLIHRRQKYKLKKEFNQSDKEQIVTAEGALKLLPGSQYSVDLAVAVTADKYISHIPLERQIRQMESLGLKKMQSKTMYNLCLTVSEHLSPLVEKIKNEVLNTNLSVHADETPWPINNNKDSDGYMWVLSNQAGSFYNFEPTRSGHVIKELLRDYTGAVVCDGYTGYNRLNELNKENEDKKIELAHCWAHARRKFTDIKENYPEKCKEILDLMDELYAIERKAKTLEELKALRSKKSVEVIDQIKKWLEENLITARAESGLRSSIEYMLKYWNGLNLFLKNEKVPLTNNEAERTIRHAVMGRKNFYGSKSINGADVTATLYTIIESCKKVELDPRNYILETVKKIIKGDEFFTPLETAKQLRQSQ